MFQSATNDEIKKHYYKYVKIYHPTLDDCQFKENTKSFHETLMDPITSASI